MQLFLIFGYLSFIGQCKFIFVTYTFLQQFDSYLLLVINFEPTWHFAPHVARTFINEQYVPQCGVNLLVTCSVARLTVLLCWIQDVAAFGQLTLTLGYFLSMFFFVT